MSFKTLFDSNPDKYKTGATQVDGYLPTPVLGILLGTAVGTRPNPIAQLTIAKPITFGALRTAAPITLGTLASAPDNLANLEVIASRVRAGDSFGVQQWADTLLLIGKMNQTEHDAVSALCSATQLDPNWSPTVPGLSDLEVNFGVVSVLHSDIDSALGRI